LERIQRISSRKKRLKKKKKSSNKEDAAFIESKNLYQRVILINALYINLVIDSNPLRKL